MNAPKRMTITRDTLVELRSEPTAAPYARCTLEEALPDDDERAEVIDQLATGRPCVVGGGAAELVIVSLHIAEDQTNG